MRWRHACSVTCERSSVGRRSPTPAEWPPGSPTATTIASSRPRCSTTSWRRPRSPPTELRTITRDSTLVALVEMLTRDEGESDHAYLSRCATDPTAVLVKRARPRGQARRRRLRRSGIGRRDDQTASDGTPRAPRTTDPTFVSAVMGIVGDVVPPACGWCRPTRASEIVGSHAPSCARCASAFGSKAWTEEGE